MPGFATRTKHLFVGVGFVLNSSRLHIQKISSLAIAEPWAAVSRLPTLVALTLPTFQKQKNQKHYPTRQTSHTYTTDQMLARCVVVVVVVVVVVAVVAVAAAAVVGLLL